jgi:hypothetical protein
VHSVQDGFNVSYMQVAETNLLFKCAIPDISLPLSFGRVKGGGCRISENSASTFKNTYYCSVMFHMS